MIYAVQLYKPQPEGEPWLPQEAVDVEWVVVSMDHSSEEFADGETDYESKACTIALTADPKYAKWKLGRVTQCADKITVLKDPY